MKSGKVNKRYVLDTSALFTLIKDEKGSETVDDILTRSRNKKCESFISFISFTEVYYIAWQGKGESAAKELVILLKALPLQCVEPCERITLSAGRIKANHRLSVSDAFIAATAHDKKAVLVHKDPGLESVSDFVETLQLPYKNR
ncbi:PIN domain-containing protein [candidate division WOR-3 bacterium]|nr:PIN domain-containing protein [candidate division WOR-3 bacterium]